MMHSSSPFSDTTQIQGMVSKIVNTLLHEGYRYDHACRIALAQSEVWTRTRRGKTCGTVLNYFVTPHPAGWVIRQVQSIYPCFVFKVREEAIEFGQMLARESGSALFLHREDGDIHLGWGTF